MPVFLTINIYIMTKKYLPLIAAAFVFTLGGCYYDVEEELYPAAGINPSTCDTSHVTYGNYISQLISSNCSGSNCHIGGSQAPDISDYTKLTSNIGLVRSQVIVNKTMPPAGPLSACDRMKLQQWIDNGMPQ